MMRPSLLLLLILLLFLSLGSSSSTFVGCGSGDVNGFAAFGCSGGNKDDPCDYIVTVQVTVLLDADSSPVPGATVYIDTGASNSINTRVTNSAGQAFWNDTSFLTGFSADCGGQDVGTVEPYDQNTSFSSDLLVSAPGLAPFNTVLTINRESRNIALVVELLPL
ncbi:MAG: hypothetical protein RRA15_03965 [bacterium]|nr:hypothetical protein [bacterium]MDT8365632.1 hypothetical protein [bacterium]